MQWSIPLLTMAAPVGQWQIRVRRGRVDSRPACAQGQSLFRFLPPWPSVHQEKTPVARGIEPEQVAGARPLTCAFGPRRVFEQQARFADNRHLSLPDGFLVSTAPAL